MKRVLATAPAVEPLNLEEVKAHLRLDSDDEHAWLQMTIRAAREKCEEVAGRKLITQVWDVYLDRFPGGDLVLPNDLTPVQSVDGVYYTPEDDDEATFASSNYLVDLYGQPPRIRLKRDKSWPADTLDVVNGVRVRLTCGYGTAGLNVPSQFRKGMLLFISDQYEFREVNYPAGMAPTNERVMDLWRNEHYRSRGY